MKHVDPNRLFPHRRLAEALLREAVDRLAAEGVHAPDIALATGAGARFAQKRAREAGAARPHGGDRRSAAFRKAKAASFAKALRAVAEGRF